MTLYIQRLRLVLHHAGWRQNLVKSVGLLHNDDLNRKDTVMDAKSNKLQNIHISVLPW